MAVLSTPAVAATVTALRSRVRKSTGDTQASATGQKYSDDDISRAIDDTIAEMTSHMYEDAGPFLVQENLTYTADAYSTALAAGREASTIYKIEDIDNSNNPIFVDYIDGLDLDRDGFQVGWTFHGNAIALRPKPAAAKTLRISFLRHYIPIAGSASPGTDQHSMHPNFEEVIVLGAAIRLQEVDDEVPPTRLLRYQGLWQQFQMYALRVRGPVYVRDTRVFG